MLRRLRLLLRWPPLGWTLVALLALIVAWYGPALVTSWDDTTRSAVRSTATTAILFVWGLWVARGLLRLVRRSLAPAERVLSSDPVQRSGALERRMDDAVAALRRRPKLPGGCTRALYLCIGPTGAGKSTLLERSGRPVNRLEGHQGVFTAEGPTQDCDWVLVGDAVCMDLSGDYTERTGRREEWLSLLGMLRRRMGVGGVTGVLVVVPLARLLDAHASELEQLGRMLHQQLTDVVTVQGATPGVTLVVTGIDRLSGLCEALDLSGDDDPAHTPLSIPLPGFASQHADTAAVLAPLFQELIERLGAHQRALAACAMSAGARLRMLRLTDQVASLEAPLGALIGPLVGETASRVPLDSVWFSSVIQGEAARAPSEPAGWSRLGLRHPTQTKRSGRRIYGTHALFSSLPEVHGGAVRVTRDELHQRRRRVAQAIAFALALVVISGVGVLAFVIANDAFQDRVVALAERTAERPGGPLSKETLSALVLLSGWAVPDWTDSVDAARQALGAAAQIADVRAPPLVARPWLSDSRDAVHPPARDLVDAITSESVLDPLEALLTERLAALAEADPAALSCAWKADARWMLRLVDRWADLYRLSEAAHVDSGDLQQRKDELLRDLSRLVRGAYPTDPQAVLLIESALQWWVDHPDQDRPASPGFAAMRSEAERVRRILGDDGVASMILRLTVPDETSDDALLLRSDMFSTQRLPWPTGYTHRHCEGFKQNLRRALSSGQLTGPDDACALDELTPTEVQDALALYRRRHAEAWERFAARIRLDRDAVEAATPEDLGIALTEVFSPRDGDLTRIMASLGVGRAWPEPLPDDASETVSEDRAFCDCLASGWTTAHSLVSDSEESSVRDHFQATLTAYNALGEELLAGNLDETWWADLARGTYAGDSVLTSAYRSGQKLLRTLESAPATPPEGCRTEDRPDTVHALVREPVQAMTARTWRLSTQGFVAQVERAWRKDVHGPWTRVKNSLPLSRSSSQVDASEVEAVIGEGGASWGFVDEHLAALFDPAGRPRQPLGPEFAPLVLTRTAQELMEERDTITQRVGDLGATWNVTFRPVDQVGGVTYARVDVDGRKVAEWRGHNDVETSAALTASSEITFTAFRGKDRDQGCLDVTRSGAMGAFAFAMDARTTAGPYTVLHVSGTSCTVTWQYKESGAGPVTLFGSLRSISLPATLFEPVK
ncbi:MAG: hypothetical protein H6739_17790 [Alphaproteobacteria bacterium]|nr:hypothetical protein [Alphaproteobacteria bacterium]